MSGTLMVTERLVPEGKYFSLVLDTKRIDIQDFNHNS